MNLLNNTDQILTLLSEYRNLILAGIGSTVLALLTGRTLRRLILLPLKLIASRTNTKEDDLLVEEAARDLGLPADAAQPADTEGPK